MDTIDRCITLVACYSSNCTDAIGKVIKTFNRDHMAIWRVVNRRTVCWNKNTDTFHHFAHDTCGIYGYTRTKYDCILLLNWNLSQNTDCYIYIEREMIVVCLM